jgi:hypothetical protein
MLTCCELDRVLASPALPVLLALEEAGVRVSVAGDYLRVTPRGRLTATQRAVLQQHKADAMRLVQLVDPGVQARRDVFVRQLDSAGPGTVPAFVLDPSPPYTRGCCFACGDALPEARFGRCWRCSLAWRLAAGVPLPADLAEALDEARIVG